MSVTDDRGPIESALSGTLAATPTDDSAAIILWRCVAGAALILLGLTWRLWSPLSDFPQVPLIIWAGSLPLWCDWVGYAAMLVGLSAALFGFSSTSTRFWRSGLVVFLFAFGAMVLIDQHRLQPWVYQFALIALLLVLVPGNRAMALTRVLTVGIYFHSALSKLDFSFLDLQGPYLLSGLTRIVGISLTEWSPTLQRSLAALMPATELLIAVGLCFRRTRFAALAASIIMHAALIVALGPWSLDHKFPVLIWNAYFVVQNILLFGFVPEVASFRACYRPHDASSSTFRDLFARSIVGAAILLPFFLPLELFDIWPSWAVYASRPARARVLIDSGAISSLPRELQQYVVKTPGNDEPCILRTDRWSLDATNAPIYPQPRFQFGVALALSQRPELADRIYVDIQSKADRWTGERTTRRVSGRYFIDLEANRFVWNTRPRERPQSAE